MSKYTLQSISPAEDGVHKLTAIFTNSTTGRKKSVKFGAEGYDDYTTYYARDGRKIAGVHKERYIDRHAKDLKTGDPTRKGYLSMYILWNKPTIAASINDYRKTFDL